MNRLAFEYLLATIAHRRELHRVYGCTYDDAVRDTLRDCRLEAEVDAAAMRLAERTYATGRVAGRWKLYRSAQQWMC